MHAKAYFCQCGNDEFKGKSRTRQLRLNISNTERFSIIIRTILAMVLYYLESINIRREILCKITFFLLINMNTETYF